ncbi:hydrolase [Streptomyces longispororuber]|uniref:Hydrolase n=1 Tax=Streptomyces longispororuber TaxID=68230 RepID=A0A919DGW6_9ACTN|nr:alpha/beta fold hydrolase [Streptomyces longispororuber]GHE41849.1 hydrolase [Streptomyces longispororuber]
MERVRTLTVDGLAYRYRLVRPTAARTEPLIALGGAFQGMYDWVQLEDALADVACLVTAGLPGADGSDVPRPEHTVDTLDKALDAVVDDLADNLSEDLSGGLSDDLSSGLSGDLSDDSGVPRVNLFGYSHGAVIAFRYAQRHPRRCARLLLGGVPAHLTDAPFARYREAGRLLASGDTEGFVRTVSAAMFCLDDGRRVHRRELALRSFRRSLLHVTQRHHAEYMLARALGTRTALTGGLTGVPTLVFAGAHDTLTPPGLQRGFAATIEGSRFVTIPDCDHMLLMERPDAVAALAKAFITDSEPPAHALGPAVRRGDRAGGPARGCEPR